MILHLQRFVDQERPALEELQGMLRRLEEDPGLRLTVRQAERLDYLYHRAVSALAKLASLPATEDVREHFAAVVATAHAELHAQRSMPSRFHPLRWFFQGFPSTLRRHLGALFLAILVTLIGASFGAYAISTGQPDVKEVVLPFSHLQASPSERVALEEQGRTVSLAAHHSEFAAQLMVNNIRVSIAAMALGVFFGIGTLILLIHNGVILGAVVFDYLRAGQLEFLLGWLLPHGSIEIPAILIAGQAGFILGGAVLGWGRGAALPSRLRQVGPDMVSLIGGVAVMLIWAGIVESFFSQYHEPVVPYSAKIALGAAELLGLAALLVLGGRSRPAPASTQALGLKPGGAPRRVPRSRRVR